MSTNLFSPKKLVSRFDSICWTCAKPIAKGQLIEYVPGAYTDPRTNKPRSIVWHADTCLEPTPQQRRTPPAPITNTAPDPTSNGTAHHARAHYENADDDPDFHVKDHQDQSEPDQADEQADDQDQAAQLAVAALRRLAARATATLDPAKVARIVADQTAQLAAEVGALADRVYQLSAQQQEPAKVDLGPVAETADRAAYEGTRRAIEEAQRNGQSTTQLAAPPPIPAVDALYQDDNSTSATVRFCLSTQRHALVSGPSGSGKTYPVRMECAKARRPVVELSAGDGIGYTHLVGCVTLERDAQGGIVTGWRDGAVLRAMRHGAVLILDELDQLPRPLLALLYGILEPGRNAEIYVPELGETVSAKAGFLVVGTGNTVRDTTGQYSGERPSAALLNRMAQIPADYLPAAQEQKILERVGLPPTAAKALAAAMVALRNQYHKQALTVAPSTRTAVQIALALLGKRPDGVNGQPPITWAAAITLYVTGALPDDQAASARLAVQSALASNGITDTNKTL
jgi:MoxR-like ATPase